MVDPKPNTAGVTFENLNGTKKYQIKSNSVIVTHKHKDDATKDASASFAGTGRSKMTYLCNSVEQNNDIKKFARIVMQLNFDW